MSNKNNSNKQPNFEPSTLAALRREKPKRGRPRRQVSRQNVYVALLDGEKELLSNLVKLAPSGVKRADIADLAITGLTTKMEKLRRAVAGRNREIPEGITDLISLYLLWDLPLPEEAERHWTSLRVTPQQAIELGRAHGTLNAAFGASRSETFSLALAILYRVLSAGPLFVAENTLEETRNSIIIAANKL